MANGNKDLIIYRLKTGKENLNAAKMNLDEERYKRSLSDSYYAMFTSARAVLARDEVDFKKHTGVISYIQKEYVKTNIFDVKFSKYITDAFVIRNNADYADFFLASKADAQKQYDRAKEFYEMICDYLSEDIED